MSSCTISGTPTSACNYPLGPACSADPCCVWDINAQDCFSKTCAELAATNSNPDVCPGCNTCDDKWTIDDARGNTPWNITANGGIEVNAGGSIRVHGYTLDAGSHTCKTSEASSIRVSSTGILKC